MEFELNEILDIIDSDMKYWCMKMGKECNSDCPYYNCSCANATTDIENVRKLAAACFGTRYEKND